MTDVPSNLVPVRLTSLPEYTGGSLLGYTYYVLGGVTYKVQMAQLDIGSVTSVDGSGGTTGLTLTGGPITTSGTLTLGGTLAVANGGTGSTTAALARAALLPSYGGNALKRLTVNAGATDVEWVADGGGTVTSVAQSFTGGLISVGGSPITGAGTLALTVAGTSGGIPYFSSGTAWASSAALAANALVVGGGAGAAPATVTTGTGVVTALGVNTGSAGSVVLFDGAMGTPSSGTVTNLTGTASININGTVGATTPSTGAFTTLSTTGQTTLNSGAPALSTIFNSTNANGVYTQYNNSGVAISYVGAAKQIDGGWSASDFAIGAVDALRLDAAGTQTFSIRGTDCAQITATGNHMVVCVRCVPCCNRRGQGSAGRRGRRITTADLKRDRRAWGDDERLCASILNRYGHGIMYAAE